jgi:hypothetical protein
VRTNTDGAQSLRPDEPRTADPDVGALSVTVVIARNAPPGLEPETLASRSCP